MYVRHVGKHTSRHAASERGTALLMIAVVTTGLIGLSFGLVAITHASAREQRQDKEDVRARYACQAAVANAVFELQRGNAGTLGSENNPVAWGTGRYWITRTDPAPDLVRLEAIATEDNAGARAELLLRRVPNTMWRFGAFGREALTLDAKARIDSYDSTVDTYANQAVNGAGIDVYAGSNGDVGSNSALVVQGEARVRGDATGGLSSGTLVLGSAVVSGTTASLPSPLELPAIEVPSFTDLGVLSVTSDTTIPSAESAYTALSVGAGQTLTIVGPARLVVTDLVVEDGGTIEIDSSNGPVEIWVLHDFVLAANTLVGPANGHPRDLTLNLLSDNVDDPEIAVDLDDVGLDANTKIVGKVYAPNAHLELAGDFELFGALIARDVAVGDLCRIHFDEDLLTATAAAEPLFETVCWRELPYAAAAAGGAP